MDILIITSSNPVQAVYWQNQIRKAPDMGWKTPPLVIGIHENWKSGAGNGLGTLYAFDSARHIAFERYQRDIVEEMRNGAAIAIYHTAGQGMRLCPLTSIEGNNKPAVKLPFTHNDGKTPLAILEAVVKQSLLLSNQRKGRLSVFWADQLFLPENYPSEPSKAHITVVSQKQKRPSEYLWEMNNWSNYGIIAQHENGKLMHLDKVEYEVAEEWSAEAMALSLGAFSLSPEILDKLLYEFAEELENRNSKMDIEPYFFMPMTLPLALYEELMQLRGFDRITSRKHHERIHNFLLGLKGSLYEIEDIGEKGGWWDLGCVEKYYKTLMDIANGEPSAAKLKEFFNPPQSQNNHLDIDANSILINSKIRNGKIRNSILCNVCADEVSIENVVAVDACCPVIQGKQGILYRIVDDKPVQIPKDSIRGDIFIPETNKHAKLWANIYSDGKADWNKKVGNNPFSYAEVAEINRRMDWDASNEFRKKTWDNELNTLSQKANTIRNHNVT